MPCARKLRRVIASALALSLLGAQPASAATITIPVIVSTTGAGAYTGQNLVQALKIYEDVVNKTGGIRGSDVHFDIRDDGSNPQNAVSLINELLVAKPAVILGPSAVATCAATAPLVAKDGPVEYCFSPGIQPEARSFVFASSYSLQAQIYWTYKHARELGYRRAAVLSATDASGQKVEQFTREALALPENKDLQLLTLEHMNPSDTSVAAQIANIKSLAPDIVFVWSFGPAFATALRDVNNAGLTVPVFTSSANMDANMLTQYRSFLPKSLLTLGLPFQGKMARRDMRDAANEFLDAFARAGVVPTPNHVYAWDPAKIVVSALRGLPANPSPVQVRDYILNMTSFPGVFGVYDFRIGDQHGLGPSNLNFVQWSPDKRTWNEIREKT